MMHLTDTQNRRDRMPMNTLEPKAVWKHFFTICSIPHPSHHEKALAEALAGWAAARGLSAAIDAAGNLVIRKPASAGREKARGVILQAHLDRNQAARPTTSSATRYGRASTRRTPPGWSRPTRRSARTTA
jgi:hypothetical protein